MLLTKLKAMAAVLFVVGMGAIGGGLLAERAVTTFAADGVTHDTPQNPDLKADTDPLERMRLVATDYLAGDAWLRNLLVTGRETRLSLRPGFNKFQILSAMNTNVLVSGTVLRIDKRDVYFQAKDKVYRIHIGESVAGATRRALPDMELESLKLKDLIHPYDPKTNSSATKNSDKGVNVDKRAPQDSNEPNVPREQGQKPRQILKGHMLRVYSVAYSPDGKTLASGDDKTITIWDVATGKELATLYGHTSRVYGVAYSPDGKTLASASWRGGNPSNPGDLKLWDVAKDQERTALKGHTQGVYSVAYSPDGKTLASASADKTVILWDAATDAERAILRGHTAPVISVAFTADGAMLASGSDDQSLKLWDVATGKDEITLRGHLHAVNCVKFSPDGKLLASSSADHTIKLWDTSKRVDKSTLKGHTDSVRSVAFSPDGKTLASGSLDSTIKLWGVKDVVESPGVLGGWTAERADRMFPFFAKGRPYFLVTEQRQLREPLVKFLQEKGIKTGEVTRELFLAFVEEFNPSGPKVEGVVRSVNAEKSTISVNISSIHLTSEPVPVAKDAKVLLGGTPAKLSDLKVGMRVTLQMSAETERSYVVRIAVEQEPRKE